jgi:hypothetical protein
MKIEIGDVCTLRSGSPRMVVTAVRYGWNKKLEKLTDTVYAVDVAWTMFNGDGTLHERMNLPVSCLEFRDIAEINSRATKEASDDHADDVSDRTSCATAG